MINVDELNGREVIAADAYATDQTAWSKVDTAKWQITHLDVSLTEESAREFGSKITSFRLNSGLPIDNPNSSIR